MINLDDKYIKYMDGILKYNESINLTSITDREEFKIKHFYDSLVAVEFPEYLAAKNIIDVGTGAGFPGIPLAIYSAEKNFTLVDSLKKRLKIIEELSGEIGLENVRLIHARAEELGRNKEHREAYDLCVSRAVANLSTLCEYCLPLVRCGGFFIAYKGPDAVNEIEEAGRAISILGGKLSSVRTAGMDEFGISHNLIVIKKIKPTPTKFPRKAGTPSKEPIR